MALCELSAMYDWVYEHPSCPTEDIIGDNAKLDKWMDLTQKELENERKFRRSKRDNPTGASSDKIYYNDSF